MFTFGDVLGEMRHESAFQAGKAHGPGVLLSIVDGTRMRHECEFRDWKPHGEVVMTTSDGMRFEGTIQAGNLLENVERDLRSAGLITD